MHFHIEHAAIRCRDLEASEKYYCRMFNAQVILRRNRGENRRIVFLRIGESMLELMEMGPGKEPGDPREHYGVHHLGMGTDDFDAAYRELKARGADFLVEPFDPTPGIRLAFLRDPNGAVIELAYRNPEVLREALEKGAVSW
jgi:lactoylglutathione lyase